MVASASKLRSSRAQRRRARHVKRIEIVPGDQLLCASVHGTLDLIRCRASSPSTAPSAAVGAPEASLVALGNAKAQLRGITREADRLTWINVVWLGTPAHWPVPKMGTRSWHGHRSSHHPLPAPRTRRSLREPHVGSENRGHDRRSPCQCLGLFRLGCAIRCVTRTCCRGATYVALLVLWVAAIIMLGMIGQNLDAAIHP